MKKIIIVSFLLFVHHAMCLDSGNIVGYMDENIRAEGVAVNRFRKPSGEPTRLSELMRDPPQGTEISFFDGLQWVAVTANLDDNGNVHWFDKSTDGIADNYEVPVGVGIRYKLPEGTTGTFLSNGEIHDSYFGDAAAIFDGGMTLDDVRLPKSVIEDIRKTLPIVTNKVTVTNTPPNRFVLRMRSGELRSAMWDVTTLALCDPRTGFNFKFPLSSVDRFEVDNTAPLELRMNGNAVAKLEKLFLSEVIRERHEKAEAQKRAINEEIARSITEATDGATAKLLAKLRTLITKASTWFIALVGFIISTTTSYYVGKGLDKINPLLVRIVKKLRR